MEKLIIIIKSIIFLAFFSSSSCLTKSNTIDYQIKQRYCQYLNKNHGTKLTENDVDFEFSPFLNAGIKLNYVLKQNSHFTIATQQDLVKLQNNEFLQNRLTFNQNGIVVDGHTYDFFQPDKTFYINIEDISSFIHGYTPVNGLDNIGKFLGWLYDKDIKAIKDFYSKPQQIRFIGLAIGYQKKSHHNSVICIFFYMVYQNKIYFFTSQSMINWNLNKYEEKKIIINEDFIKVQSFDNRLQIPYGLILLSNKIMFKHYLMKKIWIIIMAIMAILLCLYLIRRYKKS